MPPSVFNNRRFIPPTLAALVLASGFLLAQSDPDVEQRTRPVASVCMAGEPCAAAPVTAEPDGIGETPEAIYNRYCVACHASGVAGAPITGQPGQWGDRRAKGLDVLYASVINGLGAMPPRGTCNSCTDEELGAVVDYMLESEGAP